MQMCGGDITITDSAAGVCTCDCCGSRMTIPTRDDERKIHLFNRANHYRMRCDFDHSKEVYDRILSEFPDSAEGYWGLLLCRFGIEYVEDSRTRKRLPTCHRTHLRSILDDPDYHLALKYASVLARAEYQREAIEIDRIQKETLAISAKEPPYDIFICYKEEDDHTRQRTQDSVMAKDIYNALTKEGYKVFFSRITLESQLGKAFEPIVYAALRSAKVMLVVTTSREHCDAVWVKNEWGRYLDMMAEQPGQKDLIAVYAGMDPYNLPDQFNLLQALDFGRIGAMQDLLHGVEKLINASVSVQSAPSQGLNALLQRAGIFLEDGNFEQARIYCNRVLDQDPQNAQAYFYLAMTDEHLCTPDSFKSSHRVLFNLNLKKAFRFASPQQKSYFSTYTQNAVDLLKSEYIQKRKKHLKSLLLLIINTRMLKAKHKPFFLN